MSSSQQNTNDEISCTKNLHMTSRTGKQNLRDANSELAAFFKSDGFIKQGWRQALSMEQAANMASRSLLEMRIQTAGSVTSYCSVTRRHNGNSDSKDCARFKNIGKVK